MCDIIVLILHAVTEEKTHDLASFYEKVEHVFEQFPMYNMKTLFGDFNAKVAREDIFKPTIRNKSLHEISSDNGVTAVNFSISKSLSRELFPYYNIHKFT
jgi:hypothetical protein